MIWDVNVERQKNSNTHDDFLCFFILRPEVLILPHLETSTEKSTPTSTSDLSKLVESRTDAQGIPNNNSFGESLFFPHDNYIFQARFEKNTYTIPDILKLQYGDGILVPVTPK